MFSPQLKFHYSIEFGGKYIDVGAQYIVNDVDDTAAHIAQDMGLVNEVHEPYDDQYLGMVRQRKLSNQFSELKLIKNWNGWSYENAPNFFMLKSSDINC